MHIEKELIRNRTITVVTKKRSTNNSPARATSRTIVNQQSGNFDSSNRYVRDEYRIFGTR